MVFNSKVIISVSPYCLLMSWILTSGMCRLAYCNGVTTAITAPSSTGFLKGLSTVFSTNVLARGADVYAMCMIVKICSLKKPHKNTTTTPWGARKGFLESLTVLIYRLVSTYQQMKVVACEVTTKTEFWVNSILILVQRDFRDKTNDRDRGESNSMFYKPCTLSIYDVTNLVMKTLSVLFCFPFWLYSMTLAWFLL